MKNTLLLFLLMIAAASSASAQAQYEVSPDPKHPEVKVLRGILNKHLLETDTSFKWYAESRSYYHPDDSIVQIFRDSAAKCQFVIFGGTWCDDTQFIVPKFYALQELAHFPEDHISLFGVNRDKKTLGNLASAFVIEKVPTIIVLKNGKEIGRVVEYGKTGQWDKELGDLLR